MFLVNLLFLVLGILLSATVYLYLQGFNYQTLAPILSAGLGSAFIARNKQGKAWNLVVGMIFYNVGFQVARFL